MSDQRRTHRLAIQLPATFFTPGWDEEVSFASTVDLSATGISFTTKELLIKGQRIKFCLQLPNHRLVTIVGEIIRVVEKKEWAFLGGLSEYEVGMKILEPIAGDEVEYVRFLAAKMKEFFGKKNDG
jgi:hypothetical protein